MDWVRSLRAPQIAQLAAEHGPFKPSLFDERNLLKLTFETTMPESTRRPDRTNGRAHLHRVHTRGTTALEGVLGTSPVRFGDGLHLPPGHPSRQAATTQVRARRWWASSC